MTYQTSSDGVAAVDHNYYWQPIATCPRAVRAEFTHSKVEPLKKMVQRGITDGLSRRPDKPRRENVGTTPGANGADYGAFWIG